MKLKGHRTEQLQLLRAAGAISRETAVAISFGGGYRHVTLARLAEEGMVVNAYLPLQGDSRRRVSHYWLTAAGLEAIA